MSAYFEVKGTDIKWEYNGKLYSITGKDVGAVSGSPGSAWVEGNYLAYIDELNHKRLYYIDSTNAFPQGALAGAIYIHTYDSLLRAVNSSGELRITKHADHSDALNYFRHEDDSSHNDNLHYDVPYKEVWGKNIHLEVGIYDDIVPNHQNHTDHLDVPYSDYNDHANTLHSDLAHSDTLYGHNDYNVHDDTPYNEWNTHDDTGYSENTWWQYNDVPYNDWEDHSDDYSQWYDHGDVTWQPYNEYANWTDYSDHSHADVPHADGYSDKSTPYSDVTIPHSDYADGRFDWTDYKDITLPHLDNIHSDHMDWVNESHADWEDYQEGAHADTPQSKLL